MDRRAAHLSGHGGTVAGEDPSPGAATTPAAPPTTKGRSTRQRIMDAAKEQFAGGGYARVRVSDITATAGLSQGAFYRYFPDRHALTLELLAELTDEVFTFARAPLDESNPIRSVLESTRRYFAFYAEHRALFGVLVELAQTDPAVAELWSSSRQAFYSRIARSLKRGTEAGQLREDLDAEVAAEMLGSMTEFYAFQRFVLGGDAVTPVDIDIAAKTIAEIWISGVERRP